MARNAAQKTQRRTEPTTSVSPTKRRRLIKDITKTLRGGSVEGRIKTKTDLKCWSNEQGSKGQLFTFVLYDESSEIGVLVGDEQAEAWFGKIQIGKCYRLLNVTPKIAALKYKKTEHTCDLHVTAISKLVEIDGEHLPKHVTKAVTFEELLSIPLYKDVTIVGILYEICKPYTYQKSEEALQYNQNVVLVDNTKKSVTLALWNELVNTLTGLEGTSVMFENVSTREYAGKRTLSSVCNTVLTKYDEKPSEEQVTLQKWWLDEGEAEEFEDLLLKK